MSGSEDVAETGTGTGIAVPLGKASVDRISLDVKPTILPEQNTVPVLRRPMMDYLQLTEHVASVGSERACKKRKK